MEIDNSDSLRFESKIPSIEEEFPSIEKCRKERKHCKPGQTTVISGDHFCNNCNFKCN